MKLWQKSGTQANELVEQFTVGKDREMDLYLAGADVLGSLAHVKMLASIGLLQNEEAEQLQVFLRQIHTRIRAGEFAIEPGIEDVHSQVEHLLTQTLGEAGKRIHAARSRNDQVLVDLRLFLRDQLWQLAQGTQPLFQLLQQKSEQLKDHLLPGYTHLQLAMPSSFGLWLGAYAESLADDVLALQQAFTLVNRNPLGSAAGYGSGFPINRQMTTDLLGFNALNYNVVYAQMGRGRAERITAQALSSLAETLSRLAMDCTLYLNQNFGFISFPAALTTGSSIMPHKKNPDVFELIRSYCNRIKALPNEVMLMTTNLPSGYHRDLQLLKENLFPAFATLHRCLAMMELMLGQMEAKENIMEKTEYRYAFSVEAVNALVLNGVPFREAYRQVGEAIEKGGFEAPAGLSHSHEGSIGNLCTAQIAAMMQEAVDGFHYDRVEAAITGLFVKKQK